MTGGGRGMAGRGAGVTGGGAGMRVDFARGWYCGGWSVQLFSWELLFRGWIAGGSYLVGGLGGGPECSGSFSLVQSGPVWSSLVQSGPVWSRGCWGCLGRREWEAGAGLGAVPGEIPAASAGMTELFSRGYDERGGAGVGEEAVRGLVLYSARYPRRARV